MLSRNPPRRQAASTPIPVPRTNAMTDARPTRRRVQGRLCAMIVQTWEGK